MKPKLRVEEKYFEDTQLEKILLMILTSDMTKSDEIPVIFSLQEKGINYGM